MILHGDGSTNIFVKDRLLPFSKYEKETAPNALHGSDKNELYQNREVNGQFEIKTAELIQFDFPVPQSFEG